MATALSSNTAGGFRIDVRTDFAGTQRQLERLRRDVRDQVIARTLNRVGDAVRTTATRQITGTYNLTAAKTRDRLFVQRAFANARLSVTVGVQSRFGKRATNVITFGAKELKRGGVSVKIRRDSPPIRGAGWFILTNKRTGGTFVAKRTGSGRADIDPVRTIDVGQMFNSREVNAALLRTVRDRFPREFAQQLRFATRRFTRR